MPSNLITTLFGVEVSFVMAMVVLLAPPITMAWITVHNIVHDAARVAAITQNVTDIQNQIQLDLQDGNLPTTWNGNTLFSVTELTSPTPGATGYIVQTGPTSQDATVTIQYNVPLPFDRALTLIGGPILSATFPITASASYYNETQYTGPGV